MEEQEVKDENWEQCSFVYNIKLTENNLFDIITF